jgi:predicted MPP superfamily phosphohydrolase
MIKLYSAASDAHLRSDVKSRDHVLEYVDKIIQERVSINVWLGDTFDRTRKAGDEVYAWFVENVLKPCAKANIYNFIVWGNHEGDEKDVAEIVKNLFLKGVDPKTYSAVTKSYLTLGKFQLEHGHRFDAWCNDRSSFRTRVGEVFTRLDYLLDQVGIEIETLNPSHWHAHKSREFDHPVHKEANRYCSLFHKNLIFGHSHQDYELHGTDFNIYNTGSLLNGLYYVLFDDEEADLICPSQNVLSV